jgi:predicted RNA-binding protein YlxR (DUF448 family)
MSKVAEKRAESPGPEQSSELAEPPQVLKVVKSGQRAETPPASCPAPRAAPQCPPVYYKRPAAPPRASTARSTAPGMIRMTQPGYEGIKWVKSICDVCGMPVLADQARCKNQRGAYVHAQCVAAAGDDRVGATGVIPPIALTPELKEVKGICEVCRMPVVADQARCKNQRGAYVHARCTAGAGAQVLYGNIIQAAAKEAPPSEHDRVIVLTELCVIRHLTKDRQHVA